MHRWLVVFTWAFFVAPVSAAQDLPAKLAAVDACPAVVSIRKQANPDRAKLQPGRSYKVLAGNKQPPTHYRVRVPGAEPAGRWAAVACFGDAATATAKPKPAASGRGPEYVLALTWQAAFCEHGPGRPECRGQHAGRFDADHFTLHGLWPQPRSNAYCGVSSRERNLSWSRIPALDLSRQTREQLLREMPGSQSKLHRHEWLKHGTCYGKDADQYFRDSLALLGQVNQSGVQRLFADNIGRRLTAAEIRAEFDRSFGRGTGAKVTVNCKRGLINELQLHLRGQITEQTALGDLLQSAANAEVRCAAGRVDAVGVD